MAGALEQVTGEDQTGKLDKKNVKHSIQHVANATKLATSKHAVGPRVLRLSIRTRSPEQPTLLR